MLKDAPARDDIPPLLDLADFAVIKEPILTLNKADGFGIITGIEAEHTYFTRELSEAVPEHSYNMVTIAVLVR